MSTDLSNPIQTDLAVPPPVQHAANTEWLLTERNPLAYDNAPASQTFDFSGAINKGAPLAVASGAYQLYNSTLGLVTGKADLGKDLETYDQAWSSYYNDNQTAIDIGGTLAGLLIPGAGALKVLNLAKNADTALGSMAFVRTLGNLDRAASVWQKEAVAAGINQATADTLISASWRARGLQVASAAQDALVLNTFAYATLNQSQMYDDYSLSKFASDTLFGTVLMGIPNLIKGARFINTEINNAQSFITAASYIQGNRAGTPTWAKMHGLLADAETATDAKIAQQAKNNFLGMAKNLVAAGEEKLQLNLQPFLQNMDSGSFFRDFAGAVKIAVANPVEHDLASGAGIKNFLIDNGVISSLAAGKGDKTEQTIFHIASADTDKLRKLDVTGKAVFTSQIDAEAALAKLPDASEYKVMPLNVMQKHLYKTNIGATAADATVGAVNENKLIYAPRNEHFETATMYGVGAKQFAEAIKAGKVKTPTPYYFVNLLTGERTEQVVKTAGDQGIYLQDPKTFYLNKEVHKFDQFEDFFEHEDPAVADGMFLLGMKQAENPDTYFKVSKEQKAAFTAASAPGSKTVAPTFAASDTNLIGMQSLYAQAAAKSETTIPILEGGPKGLLKLKTPQQVAELITGLKDDLFKVGAEKGLTLDDLSVRLNMNAKKWVTGDKSEFALYRDATKAESYSAPINARVDLQTGDLPTREDYLASLDRKAIQEAQRVQTISIQSPVFDDLIDHNNFVDGYKAKDFVPRTGLAGVFNFGGLSTVGTAAAYMERIGALVQSATLKYKSANQAGILPSITALQKNPNALFEFNNLVNLARSLPTGYSVVPEVKLVGGKQLTFGKIVNRETGEFIKDGRNQGLDLSISPSVMKMHQDFDAIKNDFITRANAIAEAKGETFRIDPADLYYPPVDVRNRDFFAFIKGKDGQISSITAGSANDLKAQAETLKAQFGAQIDVIYKDDIKEYKKRYGDFEADQFFRSYQLDAAIRRSGKLATLAPRTDDTVIQEVLGFMDKSADNLVRGAVSNYMAKEFEELHFLGQQQSEAASSKRGPLASLSFKSESNPYQDYINTALNKSKLSSVPVLESLNNSLNLTISKAFDEIKKATTFTSDKPLEVDSGIKQIADRYGIKFDYSQPELLKTINSTYSKDIASGIVSRFNGIMTKLTLSLDAMFHATNLISGVMMQAPELLNLKKNILNGQFAKNIEGLTSVGIPGTDIKFPSQMKMLQKSVLKLLDKNDTTLQGYIDRGIVNSDVLQYRDTQSQLADLMAKPPTTLPGKGIQAVNNGLNTAAKFADKWATNPIEKFLQFMSVDATHQYMEAAGITDTALKDTVANMITRRVTGNYISGQRPVIFQGPLGHALGLFQTFMFGVGQNLTRYIADGDKAALTTFGLMQMGLFGAQSNPVFQAVNYHIGKNNADRKDLFTGTYNFGHIGDWLLYGVPSNALGLSLYTRGDLTPINPSILPTSLDQIPIVSAALKLGGVIANTVKLVQNGGGDGDTFLRAIAQNGLNRPLAGIAQLADGRSTFNSGETISSSIRDWTAWTRVVGGRPFDEQKMLDGYYRQKYYEAYDISQLKILGSAIKGKVASGQEPSDEDLKGFLNHYIQGGGNARNFQRYWTQQLVLARTDLSQRMYQKMATSPKFNEYRNVLGATSIRQPGSYFGEPLPRGLSQNNQELGSPLAEGSALTQGAE